MLLEGCWKFDKRGKGGIIKFKFWLISNKLVNLWLKQE